MGLGLRLGFPILSDMLQAKAFPCLSACTYMTICSRSIPTLPSGLRPRSCPECMSILAQSPCLASPRPPERMAILTLQSTCLHSHPARLSA